MSRVTRLPVPLLAAFGAVAVAALAVALIALGVFGETSSSGGGTSQVGIPIAATKNTTRVAGTDPTADAAGATLATYPSSGTSAPPPAVTFVSQGDWQGGIAASVLAAAPVHAPILLSAKDGVPGVTAQAFSALAPRGGPPTGGSAAFGIGSVALPGGIKATRVSGNDPASEAVQIEQLHTKLVKAPPAHIVIVSQEDPGFAMPAAAWAARSGDPILFTARGSLPAATAAELKAHPRASVYLLGPVSAISPTVTKQISGISKHVRRVFGSSPVTNAIDFARYGDGGFGWRINDPGHGFVIARSDRPMDAAAAAALSTAGTWGPLLLTDSAHAVPGPLRSYLLDLKPGYRSDPTRAIYNHIWLIGDQAAIGAAEQASIDELAELARIRTPGVTP